MEYNKSLMPKNKIYILKKDGEVYKIVGKKEDELPMRMIALGLEMVKKKDLGSIVKEVNEAIKKVGEAGENSQ